MEERPMQTNLDELKDLVKKYNGQGGILIVFTDDGYIESHTYGKTKKQCKVLGNWWKDAFYRVFTPIPFTTIFGWGNAGVPKRVTQEEWSTLSKQGAEWAFRLGLTLKDDFEPPKDDE